MTLYIVIQFLWNPKYCGMEIYIMGGLTMEKRLFSGLKSLGMIAGASVVLIVGGVFYAPFTGLEVNAADSVSITDYGAVPDDGEDDTAAFNAAINAVSDDDSLDTVVVPAGRWNVNTTDKIKLKSRMHLQMDGNAVLEVAGTSSSNYGVITVQSVEDVVISGGKIEGERDRHIGDSGEAGHGIKILDSNYVSILNMEIVSNWGDGIYLGTSNDNDDIYGCNGITIKGCRVTDNRRSNISIVDANDATIDNCYLANAYGTAPQAGINIEPNAQDDNTIPDDRICKRIKILNTTVDVHDNITDDYYGQYFGFMTHYYPYDQSVYTAYDLQISGCTFNGDCGNYSAKKAVISNTTIRGTFYDCYETILNNVDCGDTWSKYNPYANDGGVPQEDPVHHWSDVETVMMYRLYNPNTGEHFYTGSIEERATLVNAGWAFEGNGWEAPVEGGYPVYRLYNPNAGDHHYTNSDEEKDNLIAAGWNYEGIAWNSADSEDKPLFRLYNPNAQAGAHHYTMSEKERDNLVSAGWNFEGIGWFGL